MRAGALVVFIPWRAGAEESGAANFGFGRLDGTAGCWPHDGEVAGGADSILVIFRPDRKPRQRRSEPPRDKDHERSSRKVTIFVVVTRAREAGRRDADRSARSAWPVERQLAARFDGEVAGGATGMAIHDESSVRIRQSSPTKKRFSFDGVKYRFDFGKRQPHTDHRHY
jgi:hypothetical protein